MYGLKRWMVLPLLALSMATTPTATAFDPDDTSKSDSSNDAEEQVIVVESPDGNKREVIIQKSDGATSINVDGEPVVAREFKVKDGKIYVVTPDGKRMEFKVRGDRPGPAFTRSFNDETDTERGRMHAGEDRDRALRELMEWSKRDHPPVMIGVQLSAVPPVLAYHLDLDRQRATLIAAVYEDLPAAEAGINANDVIVAINGDEDASPDALRQALSDREPGDELSLEVIQAGQRRTMTLALTEYDSEKLNESRLRGARGEGRWLMLRDLMDGEGKWFERLPEDLRLRELFITPDRQVFRPPHPEPPTPPRFDRPERPERPERPPRPDRVAPKLEKHLKRGWQHIERLEQRMDEIERKLDEVLDRLVKMSENS